MNDIVSILSKELNVQKKHAENVIDLIDAGNTIPFIARYRKELTGSMDDQVLRAFADRLTYLRGLAQRREEIKNSIAEQGKLTPELEQAIDAAQTLAAAEDIYRPFKPKRKTRASVAREKGLEGLAQAIFEQQLGREEIEKLAQSFVSEEKGVESSDAAIAGACDIIAENISDDAAIRGTLREKIAAGSTLRVKAAKDEDSVYSLYYDFNERSAKLKGYQILAINRGEKEGFLSAGVETVRGDMLDIIFSRILKKKNSAASELVMETAEDSWDRLIFPSAERELRANLTEQASEQAIKNFAMNLRPLLMQPPVKNKVTLGYDPGYRTGCKLAVVDETGKVLDTGVIYPTPPHNKKEQAADTLRTLIKKYGVQAIAIGNGTASKESEIFVSDVIKGMDGVAYMMVSEAGASVYSASKQAAEEFPDYDVSLRSAVSIARRLQDPLAELVKIDPRSIGVGQYQHDMPQARLSEALGGVVEDCVNSVGADLNTASPALLSYISGLSAKTAANIVAYREENGAFSSREQLKKVPKLGPKTFTQCAGFLRVPESRNIFDNTAVHPESYKAAGKLLQLCGYSDEDVRKGALAELEKRVQELGWQKAAQFCEVGEPTLRDIVSELRKPGRDPRDELPKPVLRTDVMDINDLKPGMIFTGTVRNVVDFGAFVDIGVHQDGLVHISKLSDRFVRHPSEVVKTGDVVQVCVTEVVKEKKRISLSMKTEDLQP